VQGKGKVHEPHPPWSLGDRAGHYCAGEHSLQLDVGAGKAAVGLDRAAPAGGRDALVFCGWAKGLAEAHGGRSDRRPESLFLPQGA
jgi:hypothetical protein